MTTIHFAKMQGLGNDFMVVNNLDHQYHPKDWPINHLSDRYIGIGFDQLLVIEPSKKADFYCHIFNADGSVAEQCGNGLRCVARFIKEANLHQSNNMTIETKAGLFPIEIENNDHVSILMGRPIIKEHSVPIMGNQFSLNMSVLTLGNPHAVTKVEAVDDVPVDQWGREISKHTYFPQGVNVGFMQVMNREHARLRTFERGVGETHACGSNACAAAVTGIINDWFDKKVKIEFRYGSLFIEWQSESQPIRMTGPAVLVFKGEITIR